MMEDYPLLPHAKMVYHKMFIDCSIGMEMDNNDMLTDVCTDKCYFHSLVADCFSSFKRTRIYRVDML